MALLFYDGFEDLSESSPQVSPILNARYDYVNNYTFATASDSTLIPPPLNGGNAINNWPFGAGTIMIQKIVTDHTSGVVGVRILFDSRRFLSYQSSVVRLIQLTNTSNLAQLSLALNTDNRLEVRRGNNGTLLGTCAFQYNTQTWYYIEVAYTIDSIAGSVTVKVDGNTVLSLSGINTKEQTVAAVRYVALCVVRTASTLQASAYWYDDFYVVDTTGPAPYNTFLGDAKVLSLKPDGTGSLANWTASSGTTWAAIDDVTLFNSTDFVYTSASNNTDLYTLTNLTPTGSIIYAVKPIIAARRTDAASASLAPIISTEGILYSASSDFAITTTTKEYSTTFTTNPSTSLAWTADEVNLLESGFKSTL